MLVTGSKHDSWAFSTTTSYSDCTIQLHMYRTIPGSKGKLEYHPESGKIWKYGKAKDKQKVMQKIRSICDLICIRCGVLFEYQP